MNFDSHKDEPFMHVLIMIIAVMGFFSFGSRFVDETRISSATQTATGHVTGQKQTRNANIIYYDYACDGQTCLSGKQGVSTNYYCNLEKGDAVTVTYTPKGAENLTRIENRPIVRVFAFIYTLFMLGTFMIYAFMHKAYRDRRLAPHSWA